MQKKLVLFDFDGVLVDTLIMHYGISKETNENITLDTFKSLFNGNVHESLKESSSVKQHPRFFERYEEESRELIIPDILKNIVHELSKNHTLSIVTSTPSPLVAKLLKQSNLQDCFSDIYGLDIATSKVIKIKSLLEKYKLEPRGAVLITDTRGDVKEAQECKVLSIAVTWGFQDKKSLEKSNPAVIIDDPADLLPAIEKILK